MFPITVKKESIVAQIAEFNTHTLLLPQRSLHRHNPRLQRSRLSSGIKPSINPGAAPASIRR